MKQLGKHRSISEYALSYLMHSCLSTALLCSAGVFFFFGVLSISFGGYPDTLYLISVRLGLVVFKDELNTGKGMIAWNGREGKSAGVHYKMLIGRSWCVVADS